MHEKTSDQIHPVEKGTSIRRYDARSIFSDVLEVSMMDSIELE